VVRLLVLAVRLYAATAVETAHALHVVTMLLAVVKLGFPYLWKPTTAVHAYLCLVISLAVATCNLAAPNDTAT
jgi:hypothetical protein